MNRLKRYLYKRWHVRESGFSEFEQEAAARTFEKAANALESHPAHGLDLLAVELRALGLQLIEIAMRPYEETPVDR